MTRATEPLAPVAAVVAGPAGVGKTTLAQALATHLGACLLDLDTATAPLVEVVAGLLGSDDLDGGILSHATRAARYATVRDLAVDNLRCGVPVVLVAPFTAERSDPAAWERLAGDLAAAGGRPTLVWVHADRDVLRARLLGRAAARDAGKLADLEAHLDRIDLRPPVVPHVAVDTGGGDVDLDAVAAALTAPGG